MRTTHMLSVLLVAAALGACTAQPQVPSQVKPNPAAGAEAVQGAFLNAIRGHCGQAFAGRIVANEPPQPDDPFDGKTLVMHVRECGESVIKIPFHVGEDRSRTWVLTRTQEGLRLKHDHRHEDGSEDASTQYGGDTASAGSVMRQEFPVDAYSIAMFEREGRQVSTTNTWAIEIEPGRRFVYELSRPGGRLFQVEFDLTTPVEAPPAPWGHGE